MTLIVTRKYHLPNGGYCLGDTEADITKYKANDVYFHPKHLTIYNSDNRSRSELNLPLDTYNYNYQIRED